MRTRIFFIFTCSLLLVGCSKDWKAAVESNTSWSGSFNGTTVDGAGNKTIDLGSDDVVTAVVQKQTREGRLKVTIYDNENNPLSSASGDSKETTAAFGVVTVSGK